MVDDRIVLDVMGGDHAPRALVEGAILACDPDGPETIDAGRLLLVGDQGRVEAALAELGGGAEAAFEVCHASQTVAMDEKPGHALRAKPDSSIAVGVAAVKSGRAGAFVSMGNTGAVVGAATLGLGTLPGVRRPGIAVTFELFCHPLTILDMGANVVPKPQHLYQYGVMGTAYLRDCLGIERPRVALLNIGEESSKGTELLREAHALLAGGGLEFVGNVEGGDLFTGAADVVVTDGFTGNVALKLMEGLSTFMLDLLTSELESHDVPWGAEALAKVKRQIDYSEWGGALLLGVSGVVVIGHGRSDRIAVASAIRQAARALETDVNADIVRELEASRC